jgi:hypothetical protein
MTTRFPSREKRKRAKTIARKKLSREEILEGQRLADMLDYQRPHSRAECMKMPRPCLFVGCKHHLYLDVNPETGSIKLNFPDLEVWELPHTCALDLAEEGGLTLERIGEIMNLTRERVRQMEASAVRKIRSVLDPGSKVRDVGPVLDDAEME